MYAVIFLFLGTIIALSVAKVVRSQSHIRTNICTGHEDLDFVRDVTDCRRFFICNNGVPNPIHCDTGFLFDHIQRRCQKQAQVTNCFQCPPNEYFIDMPFDYNCIQFVRCFVGVPEHRTCGGGLLFDPQYRTCNFEKNVTCSCPVEDIPGQPMFFRDPDDCSR